MTEPARWIERSDALVVLPANPEAWTDAEIDAAMGKLNTDAIKRVLALAIRMAEAARAEKEGAA